MAFFHVLLLGVLLQRLRTGRKSVRHVDRPEHWPSFTTDAVVEFPQMSFLRAFPPVSGALWHGVRCLLPNLPRQVFVDLLKVEATSAE